VATAKQIAANRANAKKSTGPRTLAGKLITRLNALKDGLTGQLLVIAPEERETYNAFSQKLTASLNPIGIEELHVAARIVRDTWRLHRIAAIEETAYAFGLLENEADSGSILARVVVDAPTAAAAREIRVAVSNALTFEARARDFDRASGIEARLRRGLHKDYALLHHLQKERNRPHTTFVRSTRKPDQYFDAASATGVSGQDSAAGTGRRYPVDKSGSVLQNSSRPDQAAAITSLRGNLPRPYGAPWIDSEPSAAL